MMKHPEYYKRDANGKILPPVPEWTDVAGLNYANPQLRDYMIKMMEYWVQTCDIDGYRCDVASMVPEDFWMEARAAIGKIKPDFMWLAEASKPELMTQAFNIDYDWPLMASLEQGYHGQRAGFRSGTHLGGKPAGISQRHAAHARLGRPR